MRLSAKQSGIILSVMEKYRVALPSSPALFNQRAEFLVEIGGCGELLYGEVHAICPMLVGIGGIVDLLRFGLRVAQGGVHGEIVLQGNESQHGGTVEVGCNDAFALSRAQIGGSFAFAVHRLVPVRLPSVGIGLPPQAEGRHVVRADSSH